LQPAAIECKHPGHVSHARARAAAAAAAAMLALGAAVGTAAPLRPDPSALARAAPDLRERLRADPVTYFRFVNRPWTARACEAFASELPRLPIVQLHGDAHVEQYAFTSAAWGLDDFDDSARGPAMVDIVRFLGSVELAARERGFSRDVNRLFDRFFDGYRRGLADASYRPALPDVVRRLRGRAALTPAAYLAWGEAKMVPIPGTGREHVAAALAEFAEVASRARPDLAAGYFRLKRAGALRMGVGSAVSNKILMRVEGPSPDPDDDVLLEAKQLRTLAGISCLEVPAAPEAMRVIRGEEHMGRISHDILGVAPTMEDDPTSEWWIRSWEPSYGEIRVADLQSVEDLSAIVHDAGAQLGAGCIRLGPERNPAELALRRRELAAVGRIESRLRKVAKRLVGELLAGWREFRIASDTGASSSK
jgi:hypothetical protein